MASVPALDPRLAGEEARERGCVRVFRAAEFPVEHWIEDDWHVLRSLEVDVMASAPTLDDAVGEFIEKLRDLLQYLSGLEDPTDGEKEVIAAFTPRFMAILTEFQRREERRQRRALPRILRRIGASRHSRHWPSESSKPASFSQPSHA